MAILEGEVSQQEISIHNHGCWSVLADSPFQPACWALEVGKLCTSRCHSIHTQPSPAPKTLVPFPQNDLKDTKHVVLHTDCTRFSTVIYCYSFKHCNLTAMNWSDQKTILPILWPIALDRIRAAESRHILRWAIDSRNSAGSFCLEGVCLRASRLRKLEFSLRCLWSPFNPEQNRESWNTHLLLETSIHILSTWLKEEYNCC